MRPRCPRETRVVPARPRGVGQHAMQLSAAFESSPPRRECGGRPRRMGIPTARMRSGPPPKSSMNTCSFELRYRSLSGHRCGYAFPCDEHGQVDLDQLSDEARENYLYARAMVG